MVDAVTVCSRAKLDLRLIHGHLTIVKLSLSWALGTRFFIAVARQQHGGR
jgi:hypothetical protein